MYTCHGAHVEIKMIAFRSQFSSAFTRVTGIELGSLCLPSKVHLPTEPLASPVLFIEKSLKYVLFNFKTALPRFLLIMNDDAVVKSRT